MTPREFLLLLAMIVVLSAIMTFALVPKGSTALTSINYEVPSESIGHSTLYRKRVPHGWLYFVEGTNGICVAFVEDEDDINPQTESSHK